MRNNILAHCSVVVATSMLLSSLLSSCEPCDGGSCSAIASEGAYTPSAPDDSLVLKVYVENSGSMYGYVKGATQFESAIYSMLGYEQNYGGFNEMELYYINNKVLPIKKNLDDYIANLEPASFKQQGGNHGTSDIKDLLDKVIAANDANTVSVFISDCILSPGSGKDAANYVNQQEIGIRTSFATLLQNRPELMVTCYQMNSTFSGSFYDKVNRAFTLSNESRPYYIWMFGNRANVQKAQSVLNMEDLAGRGLENTLSFSTAIPSVRYAIINGNKKGEFVRCSHNPQKHIVECKRASGGRHDGSFAFTIEADFSNVPVSEAYLCNPLNYDLSSKDYEIEIKHAVEGKYHLQLTLKQGVVAVNHTDLKIRVLNQVPSWVEAKHDSIGEWLPDVYDKTFGIKNIINGVHGAFRPVGNKGEKTSAVYANIRVIIN